MAAHRRIDLALDSVRRLQRIGATANLLNLLQKQHPADLAQIFGELLDPVVESVCIDSFGDQTDLLGLVGIDEPTTQTQIEGPAATNKSAHPLGATGTRQQAAQNLGQPDSRAAPRHDPPVGGERELTASTRRVAIDHSHGHHR